ncbi:MAG: Na(+)/H(+) antiporter [Myxococcales bacterium]|nr:Na(+)/H(+) antiporter [Myxococcales bacterium]
MTAAAVRSVAVLLAVTFGGSTALADSGSGSAGDVPVAIPESSGSGAGSAAAAGSAGDSAVGSAADLTTGSAGSSAVPASNGSVAVSPPPRASAPKPAIPAVPVVPKTQAEATHAAKESTLFAIKVIGGLIALMVIAYLGGHRKVVRFQERFGISGVITAGFPFVALGVIASLPSIGVLSPEVLAQLRPVLHFGLGWLGFIIGAQLDIRVLDRVPKGTAYLILVEALGPFAITAAGCGAVMLAFNAKHLSLSDPAFWRDTVLLGTAAAMTAPRKFRGFATRAWHEGRGVDVLLAQLDELVGVIGLLFITSYFRDDTAGTWQLPNTAWVFVSLGLGVAIGILIFAMVRVPVSNAEFLAVVLGAIAFASGLAGYLHLSPIAICFIAGVLVTNFPNEQRDSIFRILNHLERPVHLLFLIIAGAVWTVTDWRGWALVPLFVAGRTLGKWTGVLAAKTAVGALLPSNFADQRQLFTPLSSLSIALVISVESLYHDTGLPWIVTAVIGGAIISEILVQRGSGVDAAPRAVLDQLERSGPIDELDDLGGSEGTDMDGPIYRDEPSSPVRPK